MGSHTSRSATSPVVPVSPTLATTFIYEDLVIHAQAIQYQMIEVTKHLNEQCANDKQLASQLKTTPISIVDPYKNEIVNQYMDHQLISAAVTKFKKEYVPKFLHSWIKFGFIHENSILPLTEYRLKSTISKYKNAYQIVTYGEVTVWVSAYEDSPAHKVILRVRLNDNMEKIKLQLKEQLNVIDIELKTSTVAPNVKLTEEYWKAGKPLQSEDTIMSRQLYQENCIIMANVTKAQVNSSGFETLTSISFFVIDC